MTFSKTSWTRAEIGALGERLAVEHLQSLGLRVLDRNWRCRYGELDVIAADDAARIVVFVEVKTRTSDQFGGVEQAVTPEKVRRLRRLAGLWLAGQDGSWSEVRIDVVGVRIGRRRSPGDHPPAGSGLMALGRAFSVAVRGLDGHIVEIEADITSGLPGVHLVGLPDAALQESRDRVRAAITNCGNEWPHGAADAGALTRHAAEDGLRLRHRAGAWRCCPRRARRSGRGSRRRSCSANWRSTAGCGRSRGCCPPYWPPSGRAGRLSSCRSTTWPKPASWTASMSWGVRTLGQLKSWVAGQGATRGQHRQGPARRRRLSADLADVIGQTQARYAVEVAAAGAHHLMLTGPPGVGKTMLAQRLPGLLPTLSESEALEVTAIHSVAGLLSGSTPLITRPPFVAPHHTSTVAAMVGGGSGMARPGAVSRAHRGVLFLDECAEIGVSVMEALRTPLGGR